MKKMKCTAIVLAGGRGRRMGTAVAKQYLLLEGKPVLCYALDVFERSELIDEVVLVVGKGQISYCLKEIVEKYQYRKIKAVTEGGTERYHSVFAGLQKAEIEKGKGSCVFIHDGARPFVDEEILKRAYEEVVQSGACVVGMPVKDTIKIADEQGCIHMTPKRSLVWQIQTPQVFEGELIARAYTELMEKEKELLDQGVLITDDAMVVEKVCSHPVKLVEGSYENIKITTPEDLEIAKIFVKNRTLKKVEKY